MPAKFALVALMEDMEESSDDLFNLLVNSKDAKPNTNTDDCKNYFDGCNSCQREVPGGMVKCNMRDCFQ